jgi:hypothetical protein
MAFSETDLVAAFDCADEREGDTRALVTQHLLGECDCQRDRCPLCGCRPRNKLPRHRKECPMALASK